MRLLIPLFSPATGTWGGLTRVVAVAEAARAAGHDVACCASGYLESSLRSRGYRVYSTPATTMFGLPGPVSRILERRSQRVSLPVRSGRDFGSIWLVLVASGLARAGYLRSLVAAEMDAAADFSADAIFTDLDPGAFLLSAVTGLPIASAYAAVMHRGRGSLPWTLMHRALNSVLRTYGKAARTPDDLCFGPSVLKIIPSIPELDGTDPVRPDVRYVGHLLGGVQPESVSDFRPEPGGRYLFVYVGTGSLSLDVLRRVLPGLCEKSGLACVVGAQGIERPEQAGEVQFRPYVPAEALLPQTEWTICHGGQNTIIESLLHGVPLLVFPGPIFERRFNAGKVEGAGAGLMGEREDFNLDWLNAALNCREASAARAAELGARIRSYGGAGAAVEAIAGAVMASSRA